MAVYLTAFHDETVMAGSSTVRQHMVQYLIENNFVSSFVYEFPVTKDDDTTGSSARKMKVIVVLPSA